MTDQNSQFFAILTDIGRAKQANATALGTKWTFAQMAVGDANETNPIPNSSQTKLINERRRAPLNQVKVDPSNPSVIIAEQIIPESVGGWWVRELGLYDADGDMVAVANCAPTYKPLLAQGSGRTQVIRINLIVSNTANIELRIDPSVVLATREYVDLAVTEVMSRLDFKHSVLVATTANIVLSGIQTVDGVLLAADARVLVKDQALAKDNGIYVVPAAGAWKRALDADASVEVTPGLFVTVEKGTANGDSVWQLVTDAPILLGTTALTFEVVAGRTGIVAGTYRSLTVDKLGRVIAGTNPTTLAGAGIADALSSTPQGVLTGAIADIAKHDVGVYSGPTTDKPTTGGLYMRWKYPGANPLAFDLYAHMASGADTFGFRRVGSDGLYIWREVYHSGNFDPSSKADKSQLGTAAALTSTISTTDATAGRSLRVGDFGLGGALAPGVTGSDCNNIEATGIYSIAGATLNVPVGAISGSMLFHMNYSTAANNRTATQEIVSRGSSRKWWRSRSVDVWGAWVEAMPTTGGLYSPAFSSLRVVDSSAIGNPGSHLSYGTDGAFTNCFNSVCNQGTGTGGFTWRTVNAANSVTGPTMSYSYDGRLNVPGSISTPAISGNTTVWDQPAGYAGPNIANCAFVSAAVNSRPRDTALLATNGWSKNADTGEIKQWVDVVVGDFSTTGTVNVTWPFKFPNQILNVKIGFKLPTGTQFGGQAHFNAITLDGATIRLEEWAAVVQTGLVLMVEARGN